MQTLTTGTANGFTVKGERKVVEGHETCGGVDLKNCTYSAKGRNHSVHLLDWGL